MSKTRSKAVYLAALLAVVLIVVSTFGFFGCGDTRYFITLTVDGTPVGTITTNADGSADLPTREKAGYIFGGWYYDEDCTDRVEADARFFGNTTLYCGWVSRSYTLTFDGAGGEFEESVRDSVFYDESTNTYEITVRSGEVVDDSPEVTREHYTFAGWTYNGNPVDLTQTFELAANVVYVASWRAEVGYVKYSPGEGGIVVSGETEYNEGYDVTQNVAYDTDFLPLSAKRAGYEFGGWYLEDGTALEDSEYVADGKWRVEGSITVTARFEAETYDVAIVYPDGDVRDGLTITYGEPYDLRAYENVPDGYRFSGWSCDTGSGEPVVIPATGEAWNVDADSDVTLTPVYLPREYAATFMVGDVVYAEINVSFGSIPELPEDPVQAGKTFVGWFGSDGERLLPGAVWHSDVAETFTARFVDEGSAVRFTLTYYAENADYESPDDRFSVAETYVLYGAAGEEVTADTFGADERYPHMAYDAETSVASVVLGSDDDDIALYFERDTVTYVFTSDSEYAFRSYRYGQTVDFGVPEEFTRRGYDVSGWRASDGKVISVGDEHTAGGDGTNALPFTDGMNFIAVWTARTYEVRLDINGDGSYGAGDDSFTVTYGGSVTDAMKEKLTLSGSEDREFAGWTGGGVRIAADAVSALTVWQYDVGSNNDGTYVIMLTPEWTPLVASYRVEIYLDGELSEEQSERASSSDGVPLKGDIGSEVHFNAYAYVIEGYAFDNTDARNLLIATVQRDGSTVLRAYFVKE